MNKAAQARFERLLRWYPEEWRERHGAVLLGTMLDQADSQNRTAPTIAEHLSAIVYGMGGRLRPRLALRAGIAALALAAVAGGLRVWALPSLAAAADAWLLPAITAACGALIALATIALVRHRGLLSEPEALLVLAIAAPALVLAALTQIGWGIAFDAADAGVAPAGLAAIWVPLLLAAWTAGAAALAAFSHAVLPSGAGNARRVVLSGLIGGIAAPILGLALLNPAVPVMEAAGVAVLALLARPDPDPEARGKPAGAGATPQLNRATSPAGREHARRRARSLSWLAAAGGIAGVAYALTGSMWPFSSADGTVAMGRGITLALTAALPLLAAVGILATAHARIRPRHIWGPMVLLAVALGGVVSAYLRGPGWEATAVGFAAASVLGGAAIGWWIVPRIPGSIGPRVALGALAGVGYAAFGGMMVAPLLAFVLPVCAILVATIGTRAVSAATSSPAGGRVRAAVRAGRRIRRRQNTGVPRE